MVSLRFPSLFSQPKNANTASNPSPRRFSAAAASIAFAASAAGAAAFVGISVSENQKHQFLTNALNFVFPSNQSSHLWGSLSLVDSSVVDNKTGVSFPSFLDSSRKLLGTGLRRKSVLGLKYIDVYAFGVYADSDDVKKILSEKYGNLSASPLEGNEGLNNDLMESDICMNVRLQIIYSKLSIRSVRSAFEDSVGSRLKKFGGSEDKELLQRFTSQFKDEYKIPKGSIIELSRERGYVLRTTIDGKEVGHIQSKLLCKSILDLYIGNEPFDKKAKEEVEANVASFLRE